MKIILQPIYPSWLIKLFFVWAVFFTFPASISWAAPADLRVVGNQIQTFGGGCTIRLKGVNVASLEWYDGNGDAGEGPPGGAGGAITATVAEAVTAWNVNAIRLPLNQDRWFGCQGPGQVTYQTTVDNIVNYCTANNVYVILDLHWSGTYNGTTPTTPCGGAGWGTSNGQQTMPDANSVTFWGALATHYANYPAVLFDIYNEPQGITWSVWRDGGSTGGTPAWTPGLQSLLTTIRGVGANNVIVAGGLQYAYDLTGVPANALADTGSGRGVVYAAHIYPSKGANGASWDPYVTTITNNYPVIVSEFGQGSNDGGTWDNTIINWLNGTNSNSYVYSSTAWEMHTGACPCLLTDWTFTPTSWHGTPVKSWLATPVPTCPSGPAPTPTNTPTKTPTPTFTNTPTKTPTPTLTNSPTPTVTSTPTLTATRTFTTSPTNSPTPSPTSTPTNSPTNSPSSTVTNSPTITPTRTPTQTPTNSLTPTPTSTPSNSPTVTPTSTFTLTGQPTSTPTPTGTLTNTSTLTASNSPTLTATLTLTSTPTLTATNTLTNQPTNTLTKTATLTPTSSPTPTATNTFTGQTTNTPTSTASSTPSTTPSNTPSATMTNTNTVAMANTFTFTPTNTSTPGTTPYISPPYPNPVGQGPMVIDIQGQGIARVKWDVFTMAFRKIKSQTQTAPAVDRISWDLTDLMDAPVASGLYFIRVEVSGLNVKKIVMKKVLVIR